MLANGIKQTTSTTGTGNLTLTAVTGYPKLSDAFAIGAMLAYTLLDSNGLFLESGIGYLSDATTLVRAKVSATYSGTIYNSSNPTAASLTGTTTVIVTPHAATLESMMPTVDGSGSNVNRDVSAANRSMATQNTAMVALRVYYVPFLLKTAAPITAISTYVTTAGAAGTTARLGIYGCKADGGIGQLLAQGAADIDTSTTGFKVSNLAAPISLPPGWYFTAIVCSGTPSVVCYQSNVGQVMGGGPLGWNSTSAMVPYDSRYEGVASAALPAAAGATTGSNLGGAVSPLIVLRAS